MGFLFEKCTFAVLDEDTIKECDLFSTEAQEVEYTGFETGTHLKTRLMYFDLIDIMPYPNNSSKDSINGNY